MTESQGAGLAWAIAELEELAVDVPDLEFDLEPADEVCAELQHIAQRIRRVVDVIEAVHRASPAPRPGPAKIGDVLGDELERRRREGGGGG